MEEQALGVALEALRNGQCIAILDSESREAETDLFFPAASLSPLSLRTLRTQAGGELYISVAHEVASTFGFPFIGEVLGTTNLMEKYLIFQHMGKAKEEMCQGSCSVGFSLDHRSLKTGAPDIERSFTCRRLTELWKEVANNNDEVDREKAARLFGEEFHTPGHIFLCIENAGGLQVRNGHTELSVAVAKLAGIVPILVGCVMLCNDGDNFGALPPEAARAWASGKSIPFLTGPDIMKALGGARS